MASLRRWPRKLESGEWGAETRTRRKPVKGPFQELLLWAVGTQFLGLVENGCEAHLRVYPTKKWGSWRIYIHVLAGLWLRKGESGRRALSSWHLWSVYPVHLGKTDTSEPRPRNWKVEVGLACTKMQEDSQGTINANPSGSESPFCHLLVVCDIGQFIILSEPQVLHL